jgi:hypothetical protein
MKNQNLSKGIVCAIVAAFVTISVQARPISITLKSDTGKMAKMKMAKKMDGKMTKKMDGKMDKKMKMKKDSAAKM